jgi:hypothetical protein
MFTIKVYEGSKQRIYAAESFTILRGDNGEAEITVHTKDNREDFRLDVRHAEPDDPARVFDKAIIENAAGRTTEIIALGPYPLKSPRAA